MKNLIDKKKLSFLCICPPFKYFILQPSQKIRKTVSVSIGFNVKKLAAVASELLIRVDVILWWEKLDLVGAGWFITSIQRSRSKMSRFLQLALKSVMNTGFWKIKKFNRFAFSNCSLYASDVLLFLEDFSRK